MLSQLTSIGSDNSLSPGRRQAIIWTNAGILLIRPLGTSFNEILIKTNIFIHENAFESVVCKMASILSRPQCVNMGPVNTQGLPPLLVLYFPSQPRCQWIHQALFIVTFNFAYKKRMTKILTHGHMLCMWRIFQDMKQNSMYQTVTGTCIVLLNNFIITRTKCHGTPINIIITRATHMTIRSWTRQVPQLKS